MTKEQQEACEALAKDIAKQQNQFKENEINDLITQLILSGDLLQHVQQYPSNGYAVTYMPYRARLEPQSPEMLIHNPLVKGLVEYCKKAQEMVDEIHANNSLVSKWSESKTFELKSLLDEALAPFKEEK